MKLQDIKNIDTIAVIENAAELFRLGKYKSKKTVESFIGLLLHRSNFYGEKKGDGTLLPLSPNKTEFNSSQDITLYIAGPVTLSRTPVNNGSGEIVYEGTGSVTVGETTVYNGSGGGWGGTWGSITGNLSNQTDLQAELDQNPTATQLGRVKAVFDSNSGEFVMSIDGTDIT